jgi:cathepsin A (carboxypeptidase C)
MLEVGKNITNINPYAWNNNASLLFIDQPAGVGFSDVRPGGTYAPGDVAAARDLQEFLRLFFSNVFPDRARLPIHIAGESYGGHYVPVTVKYILDSREFHSKNAFWGNITSMILANSVIHRPQSSMGHYELLCSDYRGKLWNETVCQRLADVLPKVEEMNLACEMSADGRTCFAMEDLCFKLSLGILFDEAEAGLRSVYNSECGCVRSQLNIS